jgi:hypothetical protein
MNLDWEQLKAEASTRQVGFLAALLRNGKRVGSTLEIDAESRARIDAEFPITAPPAAGVTTVHRRELRGLGDVVERFTEGTGIKAAVKAVERLTGVRCGCEKRRDWLNQAVPFPGDGLVHNG